MAPVKALLIAGPTASGKSGLALALAEALGGVIINADSMQCYEAAPLITAQPSVDERASLPHYLFSTLACHEKGSVGQWLKAAKDVFSVISQEDKLAIFVGGTGLYLESLFRGLASLPPVPENIHRHFAAMRAEGGSGALFRQLLEGDPLAAKAIGPHDPQRLQRALEIMETSNRSLISFHQEEVTPLLDFSSCLSVVNSLPREQLYHRINHRFDRIMACGALEEAKMVHQADPDPDHPLVKAIGMSHLLGFLKGELSEDEAVTLAKRDSRRYAKRQLTWCRQRFADWLWFEQESEAERVDFIVNSVLSRQSQEGEEL